MWYAVLNEQGNIVDGAEDPELGRDMCTEIYSNMLRLNAMDNIFYDAQRQGRISFYMTSYGEEALQFGSASAIRQGSFDTGSCVDLLLTCVC